MNSRIEILLAFALCLVARSASAADGRAEADAAAPTDAANVIASPAQQSAVSPAAGIDALSPTPSADVSPAAMNVAPVAAQTTAVASDAKAPLASVSAPPLFSHSRGSNAAPGGRAAADAALNGAVRKISEAKVGADSEAVSRALTRVFDAAIGRTGGLGLRAGGVSGRLGDARRAIAQEVSIANSASPADAPSLYLAAIQKAKESLPVAAADGVAKVVRSFAAGKADVSLGSLAVSAYQAAAAGSVSETGRLLSAFDKWETLLGAPGRPLISNAAALKSGVTDLLQKSEDGGAASAPRVSFVKKNGAYTAVLPGSGVPVVRALVAAFALAPAALAPKNVLSGASLAFASDPRAWTGAKLLYRANRELDVPALWPATLFVLRAMIETLWRRIVSFFRGASSYQLSQESGREALRRDAAAAAAARGGAAEARRLISGTRLTVAGVRMALNALARSADAYRRLTGESDALAEAESLRREFESDVVALRLRPSDELSAWMKPFAAGSIAFWAGRLEVKTSRASDGRFWRARGAAEFLDLGSSKPVLAAAAAAKAAAGVPLAVVETGDRFWASGRGVNGAARLSADLRPTVSGGGVELFVERFDPGLSRRLEDMGFFVDRDGSGLRAVIGPEDTAYEASELGALASNALAAALGRKDAEADGAALRGIAAEARRNPGPLKELAARLDGREAFARARVIGFVGDYEALAPTIAGVGGAPLLVTALRDPDTGLLAYARAARPDGAPLAAAEIGALLRAR